MEHNPLDGIVFRAPKDPPIEPYKQEHTSPPLFSVRPDRIMDLIGEVGVEGTPRYL